MRVAWITGHVRMAGNDEADAVATSRPAVDIYLNKTITDYYHIIEKYIINEWQVQWDVDPVSLHYHMVQPVVGRKYKFPADENRHIEKNNHKTSTGQMFTQFIHV